MSFRIVYTRLFECRLWHGYFLHQGDRQNFYDLDPEVAAQAEVRNNLLAYYDTRELLEIVPLGETARYMAGHKMKLATESRGFFVGMDSEPDAGFTRRPRLAPVDNLSLHFGLQPSDVSLWGNATNDPLQSNLPAIYFLTNYRPGLTPTIAGNLSATVTALQNRTYTAGDHVLVAGTRYRARRAVTGPAPDPATDTVDWTALDADRGEISGADRALLPSSFLYRLTPRTGERPSSITVALSTIDGSPAAPPKSLPVPANNDSVRLDFRTFDPVTGRPTPPVPGWYDLAITGDTSYATSHRVYLDDELYDPAYWGVVSLGFSPADSSLRLLEADGRFRLDAGGDPETPIFQVRIPTRHAGWRFIAYPGQTLPPDLLFEPPDATNRWTSRAQYPLTRYGVNLTFDEGGSAQLLPSPTAKNIRADPDGRLLAETYLGPLDL